MWAGNFGSFARLTFVSWISVPCKCAVGFLRFCIFYRVMKCWPTSLLITNIYRRLTIDCLKVNGQRPGIEVESPERRRSEGLKRIALAKVDKRFIADSPKIPTIHKRDSSLFAYCGKKKIG